MISFHLENIMEKSRQNPRHFLCPSDEDIAELRIGKMVRLIFVLDFDAGNNCRAERMWVEISKIQGDDFEGYLTNQPRFIQDLMMGDVIKFQRKHIATVLIESSFDDSLFAMITKRALEYETVNWGYKEEPINEQDSGWRLFYGDETQEDMDDANNSIFMKIETILRMEPLLENAFVNDYKLMEWSEESNNFIEIHDPEFFEQLD